MPDNRRCEVNNLAFHCLRNWKEQTQSKKKKRKERTDYRKSKRNIEKQQNQKLIFMKYQNTDKSLAKVTRKIEGRLKLVKSKVKYMSQGIISAQACMPTNWIN